MKRSKLVFVVVMLLVCLFVSGCGKKETHSPQEHWDAKPSVMIDGILYGDTGRSAPYHTEERPDRGGHTDGQISSTTESHEYPTQNDQSNFGTGYFYRFGEENTVQLFFDQSDRWKIFEAYEDQ